jgi:hypothetical protein
MAWKLGRRDFIKSAIAGSALCAGCSNGAKFGLLGGDSPAHCPAGLVSPGCRGTKVRVGKIYAGVPKALWPTPLMDLKTEVARYEAEFSRQRKDFADVEFVGNRLVTNAEDAGKAREAFADVDGILFIHLSMGVLPMLREVLKAGKPTIVFAYPYSGHEWTAFGEIRKSKDGALMDCLLTSDLNQLATAVRPFRAIHHAREAKIINITTRDVTTYAKAIRDNFGTQIKVVGREPVIAAYESIPETQARAEADRWIAGAVAVVEPSRDEIVRSCRLALAFEKMMDEEKATVITADCYGSMYHQLPAFPCVGNVRLNNMGLGGICESDLRSAMTHIILQGLTGKPGFISDPTMDMSKQAIILAHCLGSMKMDGPDGPSAPYKLRTVHERQEGCVPQVKMRTHQEATQAILCGVDQIRYFTGMIIDAPEYDRGCRTKIVVKPDGSPERLWQNWTEGLHRVTVYGNVKDDLERFCRFKGITMVDEAA